MLQFERAYPGQIVSAAEGRLGNSVGANGCPRGYRTFAGRWCATPHGRVPVLLGRAPSSSYSAPPGELGRLAREARRERLRRNRACQGLVPRRRAARRGARAAGHRAVGLQDSYLVDSASSHMLVSKIKPCMSKYKQLYCETANGSLNQLSFI
jgi:hypothetical protein